MTKTTVDLLLVDIRSAHNVGAILRSAAGFGVNKVIYSGHTPHPHQPADSRLPHIIVSDEKKIAKTALGSQKHLKSQYVRDPLAVIARYQEQGWRATALEQAASAVDIKNYQRPPKVLLILGSEPAGLPDDILNAVDEILEIKMLGPKESLNVAVAAGIALFALTS